MDDLEVELGADCDSDGGAGNAESLFESCTLDEGSASSFVRAPLEDRSKYEKLTSNLEDVSSDSSTNGNFAFHHSSIRRQCGDFR